MAKQKYSAGDDCPECGRTLQASKKGFIYCPGKDWDNPDAGCPFKGNWASSAAAERPAGDIKPLAKPSAEQAVIFSKAAELVSGLLSFLLIVARAGTGKTTCLVQLARIWSQQRIFGLFLCFARRDRKAMERRIPERAGKVMTSNGAGLSVLSDWCRTNGKGRLDCRDESPKQILSQRLREDGLIPPDGSGEKWKIPITSYYAILAAVAHVRTVKLMHAPSVPSDADFKEVLDRFTVEYDPSELPMICHYASGLFRELANLENLPVYGVDFTGQTFLPVYHRLTPSKRFMRVAVDECQDQNPYNRALAFSHVAPGGALVAVGDDCQAIYEWRGADADSLGEMRSLMTATGEMLQLPLTLCRRCPQLAIRLAQTLVPDIQALPDAPEGIQETLETEDQLLAVLTQRKKGLVICRMNAPLISLVLRLLAAGVPAMLARSNIMGQLLTMIDQLSDGKNGNTAITELLEKASTWLEENLARAAKKRDADAAARVVQDKYDCFTALASGEGLKNAYDLRAKIRSMFPGKDEEPNPEKMIVASTVHGAKGGECTEVYLLSPSGREASVFDAIWSSASDRNNTLYVAVTRVAFERDQDGNIKHEGRLVFVGPMPTFVKMGDMADDELDYMPEAPEAPVKESPAEPVKPAALFAEDPPAEPVKPAARKRLNRPAPAKVQPVARDLFGEPIEPRRRRRK